MAAEGGGLWETLGGGVPSRPALPYPGVSVGWEALHTLPSIDKSAWVAPGAVVLGRVRLKARSSVWYGCVLRGDEEYLEVGEETNIQDGALLHVDEGWPCVLGDRVTLGHHAIVHGATVEDGALIGIGARVLSRARIGTGALVAAGAVVLEGAEVEPHTLWAGCPAKKKAVLSPEQRARLASTYRHYVNNAALCLVRYGRRHIDALLEGQPIARHPADQG